jgi:DNA-binding response OmpR family regulator
MSNVLIVEDDLTIADMLQSSLERNGYTVIDVVHTVRAAIDSVDLHVPDFAVIDILLANGEMGTDVAAHMRGQNPGIGIIFSTGNDEWPLDKSLGDAVLIKPYRMADVACGLRIIAEIAAFGHSDIALPRNFRLLTDRLPVSGTSTSSDS